MAAVGAICVGQSNANAPSIWQWRTATATHAPQQLVATAHVKLYGAGGPELLVEADGRFVQKTHDTALDGDSVAVFVVGNDQATETVVGVARSDVDHLVLQGDDGGVHELPLNEFGAFAAPSLPAGTRWQLDALAADGTALSHLELPQVAASCGGPVGPCQVTGGSPHGSFPSASSPATGVARQVARERMRTTAATTHPGYTISNRGTPVASRGNSPSLFPGHSYRLFLLGKTGGNAYYRIQVTARFTCWGSGPADAIGKLGESGCPQLVGAYPLQLDSTSVEYTPRKSIGIPKTTTPPRYLRRAGVVVDQAAAVALESIEGKVLQRVIPHGNLFSFTGPFPRRFLHVVPLDAHGQPLKPHPEWGEHQTPPANLFGPSAIKANPQTLGTVVQHGSARGVTVSASQNGVVVFDTHAMQPAARAVLAKGSVSFSCFQISGQNVRHSRSVGFSSPLSPIVAFKSRGVKPRYDGCDAEGSYGHRWHDQYGPHSTIEIALSPRGARYFEDRATARDLAAFVRSAKTQAIRRLSGSALLAAIRRSYGTHVVVLRAPSATAAPGEVGVWTHGTRTIFSERSHLGDRLYVQLDAGRITVNNVRGLAFVF